MKVIYVGYSKTGTKTMTTVFRELGYTTYDFIENSWFLGKEWNQIFKHGGTVEDFKKMYQGVDALVDAPCYQFWEEILQAYPDTKLIFSVREEDSWARSLKKQSETATNSSMYVLMQMFSYSGWKYFRFISGCEEMVFGTSRIGPWCKIIYNELLWKRLYRLHNNYVLQKAPAEKLLMYDLKEGWGPICEFLGEKVPDKPFPHMNVGASLFKDIMQTHPIIKRMVRETVFNLGILSIVVAYGGYRVYRNPENVKSWLEVAAARLKFW